MQQKVEFLFLFFFSPLPCAYNPLAPYFSFPHSKCSFALPTDHKPKQETTGFLQQKGNSLHISFQPMGTTLCGQ